MHLIRSIKPGFSRLSVMLAGNATPARYQSEVVFVCLCLGAVQCLVDAAGDIRPFSAQNRRESVTHHTSSPAKQV